MMCNQGWKLELHHLLFHITFHKWEKTSLLYFILILFFCIQKKKWIQERTERWKNTNTWRSDLQLPKTSIVFKFFKTASRPRLSSKLSVLEMYGVLIQCAFRWPSTSFVSSTKASHSLFSIFCTNITFKTNVTEWILVNWDTCQRAIKSSFGFGFKFVLVFTIYCQKCNICCVIIS